MLRENEFKASGGMAAGAAITLLVLGAAAGLAYSIRNGSPLSGVQAMLVLITALVCSTGFFIVNPGEAKVVQLFGEYKGTVRTQGFWFANPFLSKKLISLRVRNFETAKLKVNDKRQSDRDRGDRGVERGGHRGGAVRGGQLRHLRCGTERVRGARGGAVVSV